MGPNVLAAPYASPAPTALWTPQRKVSLERRLWIAVLTAQRELGVDVPDGVIEDYRAVVDDVNLASIAARERVTRHDVKARIEEFDALAGHQHAHKGMTSRDLTENVEQLQIRESLRLVAETTLAVLAPPARRASAHAPAPRGRRARGARRRGPQPQRRRAGHDARQALRHRRRRDARGAPP